jgi:alcohol dehydrogenase (cytochrome c)
MADAAKGETIPAAPIAWNGMVFIGQAGGDNKGVRGRMMAFNQADGKQVWSFDLVPVTGEGADTWPPETPENPRTGGATWTSYTLDAATGSLYVPVGNAAPDFDIKARPGLNLYTNSIVVLDAKTGAFREYYQLTPNDFHDWDVASAPAVIKTSGGKNLVVGAGKDGILHAVDPAQKKEIYKTPVTTIENVDTPFTADKTTHFCPGVQGGVEWNGPAFHPTGESDLRQLDRLVLQPKTVSRKLKRRARQTFLRRNERRGTVRNRGSEIKMEGLRDGDQRRRRNCEMEI